MIFLFQGSVTSFFLLLIHSPIASNKISTIGPLLRSLTLKSWLTMCKSFSCYENATSLLQLMDKEYKKVLGVLSTTATWQLLI
jgi:hypothetical protein